MSHWLHILAGPNGTGKTTFYSHALREGLIDSTLPFVNIDLLTQQFGAYTEENIIKAQEQYRKIVGSFIERCADFMIESNLAESKDYSWIEAIKKKGYQIKLYYLNERCRNQYCKSKTPGC